MTQYFARFWGRTPGRDAPNRSPASTLWRAKALKADRIRGAMGAAARGIRSVVVDRLNFDVNATTSLHPQVRLQLAKSWADPELDGNPASAHQLGQRARAGLEQARRRLAAAIDADPLSVIWTSGGTESNALAVLGVVGAKRKAGQAHGVLASPLEHPCVLEPISALAVQGVETQRLAVDAQGRIDARQFDEAKPGMGLLCTMLASHELGNVYPVSEYVAQLAKIRPELWVHCDAVQALGKCELSFAQLGVHSMALSAHKFGGPKGIGALIVQRGSKLEAQLKGGSQERGFRAGTPSVRLAQAMALAAELAVQSQAQTHRHCMELYHYLRPRLLSLPGIAVLGDPESHLGNTLCLLSRAHRGQDLMIALDLEGFEVSTGAACSVGAATASPAIMAMGYTEKDARGVLRISWGPKTELDAAKALVTALSKILERLAGHAKGEQG